MRAVLAALLAFVLALPQAGVFVPGKSLGGVRLGATEKQVRSVWGPRVGVCRGCRDRTLYFTYAKFDQVGAGPSSAAVARSASSRCGSRPAGARTGASGSAIRR